MQAVELGPYDFLRPMYVELRASKGWSAMKPADKAKKLREEAVEWFEHPKLKEDLAAWPEMIFEQAINWFERAGA